jgi:hypothetical protein
MRWYRGDFIYRCLGWELPPVERHSRECRRNPADTFEILDVYTVHRFGGVNSPQRNFSAEHPYIP